MMVDTMGWQICTMILLILLVGILISFLIEIYETFYVYLFLSNNVCISVCSKYIRISVMLFNFLTLHMGHKRNHSGT